MKLRVLVGAAFLVAPLLTPGIAGAKGVRVVELTGPGLDHPIQLERDGTTEQHADALATATGLYLALSGPLDALAASAPPGDLGPRYVATYKFFGPGGDATIRQHLYPFSRTGVVTYVPPGQALFGTGRPTGGWYQVPSDPRAFDLRDFLVAAGLPTRAELEQRRESVGVDHHTVPPSLVAGVAVLLGLAVVAVGQWRVRRLLRPTDRLSQRRASSRTSHGGMSVAARKAPRYGPEDGRGGVERGGVVGADRLLPGVDDRWRWTGILLRCGPPGSVALATLPGC